MLSEGVKRLCDGPTFAKLTIIGNDGWPRTMVMWHRRVDNTLRMICPAASMKARRLARDPRATVLIDDAENPY